MVLSAHTSSELQIGSLTLVPHEFLTEGLVLHREYTENVKKVCKMFHTLRFLDCGCTCINFTSNNELPLTYTTFLSSFSVFAPVAWSPRTAILSQRLQLLRGSTQIHSLQDRSSSDCEPEQWMVCAHDDLSGYVVFVIWVNYTSGLTNDCTFLATIESVMEEQMVQFLSVFFLPIGKVSCL